MCVCPFSLDLSLDLSPFPLSLSPSSSSLCLSLSLSSSLSKILKTFAPTRLVPLTLTSWVKLRKMFAISAPSSAEQRQRSQSFSPSLPLSLTRLTLFQNIPTDPHCRRYITLCQNNWVRLHRTCLIDPSGASGGVMLIPRAMQAEEELDRAIKELRSLLIAQSMGSPLHF
jgi:hypothetical protein